MIEYFGDNQGRQYRGVQAWQILVGAAYHRQTLTYDEMSEIMDYGSPATWSTRSILYSVTARITTCRR